MAIIANVLILLFSINMAIADIESMFKRKAYSEIANKYIKSTQVNKLSKRELILLSHSLRLLKRYRDDLKVVSRILKQEHYQDHIKIKKHIANKETLDIDDYPKSLPLFYWYLFNDYAEIILAHDDLVPQLKKEKQHYTALHQILSELEFREGKVERLNDKVTSHLQYLEDKIYHFSSSFNLQYVSWQASSSLHNVITNSDTGLIVTNKGYCVGGDVGIENGFYHFYLDGCYLIGAGAVSAYGDSEVTYEQNIPATGLKIGPAASMIVSSSKSRIGIGIPFIYNTQKLSQPADTNYEVEQISPLSILATLNSRWQFDKWYLRMEFGQYFQKQESFWGLGFGRQF